MTRYVTRNSKLLVDTLVAPPVARKLAGRRLPRALRLAAAAGAGLRLAWPVGPRAHARDFARHWQWASARSMGRRLGEQGQAGPPSECSPPPATVASVAARNGDMVLPAGFLTREDSRSSSWWSCFGTVLLFKIMARILEARCLEQRLIVFGQ